MLAQNLTGIQQAAGISAPDNIGPLISKIVPYIFGVVGLLLLIYIVLGGFQLMTSQGDPKAIAAAQAKITSAVIGFVIVLISAGIVVLLGKVLGVSVFSSLF